MNTRRSLLTVFIVGLMACSLSGPRAEVSAEVDEYGVYKKTTILANASVKNLKIWTVQRQKNYLIPLNPTGDERGDLWPLIIENPLDGNQPWVTWSYFNGNDYDLAWSRFQGVGWESTGWVDLSYATGDDLDPSMVLDLEDGGRPYLAWWRDEGGTGRVYFSIFLRSRWMMPFLISDLDIDSRYPSIAIREDGKIDITFETPDGFETRTVVFNTPHTITDDLNPLEHVFLTPDGVGGSSLEN